MSETLIRQYYQCFNERRFGDAAELFADDALLDQFGRRERGSEGYVRFATAWHAAFPDGTFAIERVDHGGHAMFDVYLLSSGTHRGVLDLGVWRFEPTGTRVVLHLRELLDIRNGKITLSSLSFDFNELVSQLSIVDYSELLVRLERIRQLTDELAGVLGDARRQREVAEQLGPELDAARRALRPHYNR